MRLIVRKCVLSSALILFLAGCAPYLHQPMKTKDARLGTVTSAMKELSNLPPPREKIVAAVYKFRDQTGQYKESETSVNWSTAVTQGATSILLRALEESDWFVPIEREGLSNLLNERKIIRSSRLSYGGEDEEGNVLPPLLFAGILLEGGVISFDSNILTGGAGLRYFGAGGSGQYRQDRVTIYLRAISTSNGRILKTVYTSKTILSQMVDAGLFRFVSFKRLLEAETGFTYNEPTELAVREAIEKAVFSLIIEGIEEGLWELQEPGQLEENEVIGSYFEERNRNYQVDEFGIYNQKYRNRFAFGANAGLLYYGGDYANPTVRPMANLEFTYHPVESFNINLGIGKGQLATDDFYKQNIDFLDLNFDWIILPRQKYTPFITLGTGLLFKTEDQVFNLEDPFIKANYGGGFEYILSNKISLKISILNHYLLNDNFDGIEQGKFNDFFWNLNFGARVYFK